MADSPGTHLPCRSWREAAGSVRQPAILVGGSCLVAVQGLYIAPPTSIAVPSSSQSTAECSACLGVCHAPSHPRDSVDRGHDGPAGCKKGQRSCTRPTQGHESLSTPGCPCAEQGTFGSSTYSMLHWVQAVVDKSPVVASAVLVSAMHLLAGNAEIIKRWTNEIQEAVQSKSAMVCLCSLTSTHW